MSHIVAQKCAFDLKNRAWIKSAIGFMEKEFPGMMYSELNGMILVRYAPIETYQKQGNLRFVPADNGSFEMQYDYWECGPAMNKVRDSFFVNYQRAGANAYAIRNGFTAGKVEKTEKGLQMIAQKW